MAITLLTWPKKCVTYLILSLLAFYQYGNQFGNMVVNLVLSAFSASSCVQNRTVCAWGSCSKG